MNGPIESTGASWVDRYCAFCSKFLPKGVWMIFRHKTNDVICRSCDEARSQG